MVGNKNLFTMKQIIKFIFISACVFLIYACGDSDLNDPKGSDIAPAKVTVDSVRNLNGKSIIFFTQPADKNFKYLRVVYNTDTEERTTNVSYYTDSVIVEGFGAAGEYNVKLYSVSAGEASSDAVELKVNPLRPSFLYAYDKMSIVPTFGGIRVLSENIESDMLTFYVYKKGDDGEWNEAGAIYTTARTISHAVRGLDAVESEIGVIIKDRWGHRTEMLTETVTPWYEEMCDKKKFGYLRIDEYESHTSAITILWDGVTNNYSYTFMNKVYYTDKPTKFTIDLGAEYQLSRFEFWGRQSATNFNEVFKNLHPKEFEIWGRTDDRTTGFDENDPSWILIMPKQTVTRADGSTTSQELLALTTADKELANKGHEFMFNEDAPAVRYVCYRSLSNYGGNNTRFMMNEVSFYGTPTGK